MPRFRLSGQSLIILKERGLPMTEWRVDYRHIIHAAQHPVALDYRQAAAVNARQELDLRIGSAFTRFQTMALQERIPKIADEKMIISYGSTPSRRANVKYRIMSISDAGIRC